VNRFSRLFALIAALHLLGGHWALLQTAAWVGMAVEYSRNDSIPQALAKTFDGEHPCQLCHAVKKGRSEEQQQPLVKLTLKAEAVLPETATVPEPCTRRLYNPTVHALAEARSIAPPTPPPLA
jgi:hypothetical protein